MEPLRACEPASELDTDRVTLRSEGGRARRHRKGRGGNRAADGRRRSGAHHLHAFGVGRPRSALRCMSPLAAETLYDHRYQMLGQRAARSVDVSKNVKFCIKNNKEFCIKQQEITRNFVCKMMNFAGAGWFSAVDSSNC